MKNQWHTTWITTKQDSRLDDWLDWKKTPSLFPGEKSGFNNFFNDEDEVEANWNSQQESVKEFRSPQAKSAHILVVKSHEELEKAINELSWYTQHTVNYIMSNADTSNPEHIAHMSDTIPFIFDKLWDVSLCLREEWVSNVYNKNDGSTATLGFIEHPDHFDIINPLTWNSEYSVTNVRHDWHYAVTSISINDWLIIVVFNIEINNSNKLSCIATNLGWQALAVYTKNNQISTEQNMAYNDLVEWKSKDRVFESFLFLLNSWYYTSNLNKIFTPKKACNK